MIPTMVAVLAQVAASGLNFWRCGDLRGPACWLPSSCVQQVYEQCAGEPRLILALLDEYNRRYRARPNLYPIWVPGLEHVRFQIGTKEAFRWDAKAWRCWQQFLNEVRAKGSEAIMPLDLQRQMPLW